jgi:hypothetical protein
MPCGSNKCFFRVCDRFKDRGYRDNSIGIIGRFLDVVRFWLLSILGQLGSLQYLGYEPYHDDDDRYRFMYMLLKDL